MNWWHRLLAWWRHDPRPPFEIPKHSQADVQAPPKEKKP